MRRTSRRKLLLASLGGGLSVVGGLYAQRLAEATLGWRSLSRRDHIQHLEKFEHATGTAHIRDAHTLEVHLKSKRPFPDSKLLVVRQKYPKNVILDYSISESVIGGITTGIDDSAKSTSSDLDIRTISLPVEPVVGELYFYRVYVVPTDIDEQQTSKSVYGYLCETPPLTYNGKTVQEHARKHPPLPDLDTHRFTRKDTGNEFRLKYTWTNGTRHQEVDALDISFDLSKSVLDDAFKRKRGHFETVRESKTNPLSTFLMGQLLEVHPYADLTKSSRLSPREQEELLQTIFSFVSSIDYGIDLETVSIVDYIRTIEETLVAGVADCKDTTMLFIALASQPPLNLNPVVVIQPGHMFAAIPTNEIQSDVICSTDNVLVFDGKSYLPFDLTSNRRNFGWYDKDKQIVAAYAESGFKTVNFRGLPDATKEQIEYMREIFGDD